MSFQKLIVAGPLAKDPEVKTFQDGSITKVSIACNEKWGGGEHTEWFNLDVSGKAGENVAKYMKKGSAGVFECTVRTTEKDGKKYTNYRCFNVKFIGGQQSEAPTQQQAPANEPSLDEIPF